MQSFSWSWIPNLFYDIVARLIPGSLFLAALFLTLHSAVFVDYLQGDTLLRPVGGMLSDTRNSAEQTPTNKAGSSADSPASPAAQAKDPSTLSTTLRFGLFLLVSYFLGSILSAPFHILDDWMFRHRNHRDIKEEPPWFWYFLPVSCYWHEVKKKKILTATRSEACERYGWRIPSSCTPIPATHRMLDQLRVMAEPQAVRLLKLRAEQRSWEVLAVGFVLLLFVDLSLVAFTDEWKIHALMSLVLLILAPVCMYLATRSLNHFIVGTIHMWLLTRPNPVPDKIHNLTIPCVKAELSASFRTWSSLQMVISDYKKAVVSAPALQDPSSELSEKDLLSAGKVDSSGKYNLDQHLLNLSDRKLISKEKPLIALGLRNNLVNPRCILIADGKVRGVKGEQPLKSQRPYYGIGIVSGRFQASLALGPGHHPDEWNELFFSGIPVCWDDMSEEDLFAQMLIEASDHSHLFRLPRGNHPQTTPESREIWQRLHEVFMAHLLAPADEAIAAMYAACEENAAPLQREDEYFHSVLGVDAAGCLVNVVGMGRLEELGQAARRLGCQRAICIENSGSVMPTFLPEGISGPEVPLIRAPNFRPRGRALLVVELENPAFGPLGVAVR